MITQVFEGIEKRGREYNIPFFLLYPFRYPKFALLGCSIILAYALFRDQTILGLGAFLSSLGYLGSFILGLFYAYGFTSAPATSLLLISSSSQNILLTSILAGLGAMLADLTIFSFIRSSFDDELKKMSKEPLALFCKKKISKKVRKPLLMGIGALFLASPLPDEIGVTFLAATTKISQGQFTIVVFLLNTFGIFTILTLL